MTPEDIEAMSNIDPKEFIMSDTEVLGTAFDISQQALAGLDNLPVEHRKVLRENSLRIYSTVVALLENTDFEYYWEQ